MDGLSVQTVLKDRNCLFWNVSILLEDKVQYIKEKWYNKFMLCLRAKSFNHQLQFLIYPYPLKIQLGICYYDNNDNVLC
jgi:hypothetical protein